MSSTAQLYIKIKDNVTSPILEANIQCFKNIVKELEEKKRKLALKMRESTSGDAVSCMMMDAINLDSRIWDYEEKIQVMESRLK